MIKGGENGMRDSPLFIMEHQKLIDNLTKLAYLQDQTGIKILHTLKSFNQIEGLEVMNKYLSGFSVGNQNELNMLDTLTPKHLHSYSVAFQKEQIEPMAKQSSTLSFNSINQWNSYSSLASKYTSIGLRINPSLNIKQPKYCNPNYNSRLGIPQEDFLKNNFQGLEGLHFHVLCNQQIGSLKYLLAHIDRHYSHILPNLKWLNLGGGHQLTDSNYDHTEFIKTVNIFSSKYPNLTIILEPGDSVVKNTGYFSTTIIDIIHNTVILNTSIETHLLDIAITKQKPTIKGTTTKKTDYNYTITGISCIAGDIIGDYYFNKPLQIGDRVIFEDMMGYTMVKQTEFNGIDRGGFLVEFNI